MKTISWNRLCLPFKKIGKIKMFFLLLVAVLPSYMILHRLTRDRSFDTFEVIDKVEGHSGRYTGFWIEMKHGNGEVRYFFSQNPFSVQNYKVGERYEIYSYCNGSFYPSFNSFDNFAIGMTVFVAAGIIIGVYFS